VCLGAWQIKVATGGHCAVASRSHNELDDAFKCFNTSALPSFFRVQVYDDTLQVLSSVRDLTAGVSCTS
jgi:hypothetical protein